MKTGTFAEKALVVGTSSLAWKIVELLADSPSRYAVVGFVDDAYNTGGIVPRNGVKKISANYPFPIIGPIERLDNAIKDLRPDRIIIPLTEDGNLPFEALLNSRIEGLAVEDGYEFYERLTGKLAIENLPASSLVFSKDLNKPAYQRAFRRLYNLGLAVLALLLTAPLMAIIAVAIKLDSRGPVFFFQERVGLRGRTFRLIKFRTMYLSPSPESEAGWSRDVTSRVTRVGKFLRRFRLDELLQFFNVLRADMDVVGPRPEMACNVKMMAEEIRYYSLRHMVRPGITGMAQIKSGYALDKDQVAEKVRYDLYYIKHMSFWFDLRILIETAKMLLLGRRAQ